MKIHQIKLRNYRCFADFEANFSKDHHLHVLLAPNMAGKTALMRALRIAISTYLTKINKGNKGIEREEHRVFGKNPIVDVASECFIEAVGSAMAWNAKDRRWELKEYAWKRYRNKIEENTKVFPERNPLITDALKRYDRVREFKEQCIPLFMYAGTEYIHQPHAETSKLDANGESGQGYWYCFMEKSMERYVFNWLLDMYLITLDTSRNAQILYEGLPQAFLDLFENTLKKVLPEVSAVKWIADGRKKKTAQPYVLTFLMNDETVNTYQMLSDGFRYIVLLVGELTVRALLLNKHLGIRAADEVDGVVLIDEFGIHLHPEKQNDTIKRLANAFPKIQFIVSTHSPMVVNGLQKEQIHILEALPDGSRTARHPDRDVVGLGAEGILLALFGLDSTFDDETILNVKRYHELKQQSAVRALSGAEQEEFGLLMDAVGALAYDGSLRDPLYQRLLEKKQAMMQELAQNNTASPISDQEAEQLMDEVLDEWKSKLL